MLFSLLNAFHGTNGVSNRRQTHNILHHFYMGTVDHCYVVCIIKYLLYVELEIVWSSLLSLYAPSLQLKPYQLEGLNWLALMQSQNLNSILADEMVRIIVYCCCRCPVQHTHLMIRAVSVV